MASVRVARSADTRLSVLQVIVSAGQEADFLGLVQDYQAILAQKTYGRVEVIRDEAEPLCFYAVRYWASADAARACHADLDAQALTLRLYTLGQVTHIVNGARPPDGRGLLLHEERTKAETDRRSGFDRRARDTGRGGGERRCGGDRRIGPRRLRGRAGEVDLIAAARRAREFAEAPFSSVKIGAAIEAIDGAVVTGCNVENATYGLTICAERVAIFKALSEGQRAFTRLAVVGGAGVPIPPCGACRQILWEFGGDLEILLANVAGDTIRWRLKDLLPSPFDARLL
jgi:cytidine deaminase